MVGHHVDLKISLSAIINVAVMATFSFIANHLSIVRLMFKQDLFNLTFI